MHRDSYGKLDYRSLIAWPQRLAREWPLLESAFEAAPVRRILDLGSATGEHARLLASHGFEVAGVELSPALVEEARAATAGDQRVTFVAGDIARAAELVAGPFGGAICLGNTLPHVGEDSALLSLARQVRELLIPGATFLLQVLNYDRIFTRQVRYLPPTFRPHPDGEVVFLRILDPQPDGRTVVFTPSTLLRRSSGEPPIAVMAAERLALRGWRASEIESALRTAGFGMFTDYGGFDGSAFETENSTDLILLAR